MWARAEYLLWWIKETGFVPLVTLGSPLDERPDALGQAGTRLLFGGGPETQNPTRNGGRFTLGGWLDDDDCVGVEAAYWFLGGRAEGGTFVSGGSVTSPILARPFFDALAGREDSELIGYPGLIGGALTVHHSTFFQGTEANAIWRLADCKHYRIDLLAGFRWMHLEDALDVGENTQVGFGSPLFAGDSIAVRDHFGTRNDFYGAQVGLRGDFRYEHWFLDVTARVALGDSDEEVNIHGFTSVTPPGGVAAVTPAGLLALPTNSGDHHRDAFAVVPAVDVSAGYAFNEHVRFAVGYSFIYWSDVARAANQIDRKLSVTQVPTSQLFGTPGGPSRPAFSFSSTDFWAQGVSFALEFRY